MAAANDNCKTERDTCSQTPRHASYNLIQDCRCKGVTIPGQHPHDGFQTSAGTFVLASLLRLTCQIQGHILEFGAKGRQKPERKQKGRTDRLAAIYGERTFSGPRRQILSPGAHVPCDSSTWSPAHAQHSSKARPRQPSTKKCICRMQLRRLRQHTSAGKWASSPSPFNFSQKSTWTSSLTGLPMSPSNAFCKSFDSMPPAPRTNNATNCTLHQCHHTCL